MLPSLLAQRWFHSTLLITYPVQWSCRSLIVDTLPTSKQQLGSAWAGRTVAIGHLLGYGAGALDLERVFGTTIGDTQFKRMTVIAAFTLVFAVGVTSYAVTEKVLISDGYVTFMWKLVVTSLTVLLQEPQYPRLWTSLCFPTDLQYHTSYA